MPISIESIKFFGDIRGLYSHQVTSFLRATEDYLYGGSYPAREDEQNDDEVIRKTRDLLIEAGLTNPSPIIPCSSAGERMRQILRDCHTRMLQDGSKIYIVDNNPLALVTTARSFLRQEGTSQTATILKAMTIIKFGTTQPSDYVDSTTGVREVSLPSYASRFPTHPAPAA